MALQLHPDTDQHRQGRTKPAQRRRRLLPALPDAAPARPGAARLLAVRAMAGVGAVSLAVSAVARIQPTVTATRALNRILDCDDEVAGTHPAGKQHCQLSRRWCADATACELLFLVRTLNDLVPDVLRLVVNHVDFVNAAFDKGTDNRLVFAVNLCRRSKCRNANITAKASASSVKTYDKRSYYNRYLVCSDCRHVLNTTTKCMACLVRRPEAMFSKRQWKLRERSVPDCPPLVQHCASALVPCSAM